MEWLRPPLVATVLGVLQVVFPVRISEYVYIVLSSIAFFVSCYKLSEEYDIWFDALYVFALSPFVIYTATLQGTELLYLTFITLFVADFDSSWSGLWMGLAFLTRYSGIVLIPIAFFQRKYVFVLVDRYVIRTGLIALLVVSPWLIFNYIELGHLLASPLNFYALNAVERASTSQFDPISIILISGISTIFALYYLWKGSIDSIDIVLITLGVLTIVRQLSIDRKETRFLIELSLVAAVLAAKVFQEIDIKFDSKHLLTLIMISYIIIGGVYVSSNPLTDPSPYIAASDDVGDCLSVSNEWVHLAYAGTPAGPGGFEQDQELINQGYKIVTFVNNSYRVQGTKCIQGPYDITYIDRLQRVYDNVRYCDYIPLLNTCGIERRLANTSLQGFPSRTVPSKLIINLINEEYPWS